MPAISVIDIRMMGTEVRVFVDRLTDSQHPTIIIDATCLMSLPHSDEAPE